MAMATVIVSGLLVALFAFAASITLRGVKQSLRSSDGLGDRAAAVIGLGLSVAAVVLHAPYTRTLAG